MTPNYAGEYPAGGIVQLMGRGRYISYCAFEKGTAPVGATVWGEGALIDIRPLEQKDFSNVATLNAVFRLDDNQEKWTYIPEVPGYPVPAGLFDKEVQKDDSDEMKELERG